MPPPELAADAPVLNVAHPLVVGVHPLPGHKAHLPALHGVDGFLRDGFRLALAHFAHGDEPLVGQHRLHHLARAGANGQHVFVRLDVDDITARLQIGQELLARLVAVQPPVGRGAVFIDARLRREDGDERQVMPLGAGVVVEVVRAGDLHAAGAEFAIDEVVGNDGNVAVVQRQLHPLAHQVAVALVFGVHGQRAVGHHGFGARGGNGHAALQLAVNHLRAVHEGIADVVHLAVGLHAFHFQIAHRAFERRVPVHQALAPVNQALFIQAHEGFGHHFRQALVHREVLAAPVHAVAHAAHLLRDGVARLLLPLPHAGHEILAAQVMTALPLALQLALHHDLRGNARVIGARNPDRVEAPHAVVAREAIHDGLVEGMPHVQRARHIGRRQLDGKVLAPGRCFGAGRARAAKACAAQPHRFPLRPPAGFDGGRLK